jgi:hypothetical protein
MSVELRDFHTKVAGVTQQNDDGTDRQAVIRRCRRGERVDLVPEPENPVDPEATSKRLAAAATRSGVEQ